MQSRRRRAERGPCRETAGGAGGSGQRRGRFVDPVAAARV
jgi:hypothetical protein